jgi:O-antigen/teichoic acid export membrane protein
VIIYSAGDAAARALGFISVPIYTHVFVPAEYSLLAFVTTLSMLAAGVAILGGDTVLTRFWFRDGTTVSRRSLATTWIGFLALSSTVVCLVLALLVPSFAESLLEEPGHVELLWIVLATVPVANTSRMLAQILRNEFRPVPYAVTSFGVGAVALPTGLLLVFGLDLGIAGILVGILVGEAVILLVRAFLTRSLLVGAFDRQLLRRLLRFGLPLVPVTISFWVFTASDRVVLAKLGSFAELGYYSVAMSLVSILALLSAAVGQAWVPRLVRLYEQDKDRASRVVGASITYFVMALGFVALAMSVLAPELIALLSSPEYAPASKVVPLLALGAVAYGSSMLTSSGLTLTYRTAHLSTLSVGAAAVNVVLAVLMVPWLGMVGAALASLLGYVVLTSTYLVASQRAWSVVLERRRLLGAIGVLLVTTTAAAELRTESLGLRLLLLPSMVVLTVLAAGVNERDRRVLGELTGVRRSKDRPVEEPNR